MKIFYIVFFSTCLASFFPAALQAQQDVSASTAVPSESEDAQKKPEDENKHIYERLSIQNLSRLYWALSMMDASNDTHVDNFLMINECNVYKDYYFNEFEWKKIRDSARDYLLNNKQNFPLRFEIAQPLYLGEYDLKNQIFKIVDNYQFKEVTRLEALPNDYDTPPCMEDESGVIKKITGYPLGLILAFNRPLNLVQFPVDSKIAQSYIDEKLKAFKFLREKSQDKRRLYELRDAYIFFKVKFFAFEKQRTTPDNVPVAELLTVLEGFEIYADKEKKTLLYAENFKRQRPPRPESGGTSEQIPPLNKNPISGDEIPAR